MIIIHEFIGDWAWLARTNDLLIDFMNWQYRTTRACQKRFFNGLKF